MLDLYLNEYRMHMVSGKEYIELLTCLIYCDLYEERIYRLDSILYENAKMRIASFNVDVSNALKEIKKINFLSNYAIIDLLRETYNKLVNFEGGRAELSMPSEVTKLMSKILKLEEQNKLFLQGFSNVSNVLNILNDCAFKNKVNISVNNFIYKDNLMIMLLCEIMKVNYDVLNRDILKYNVSNLGDGIVDVQFGVRVERNRISDFHREYRELDLDEGNMLLPSSSSELFYIHSCLRNLGDERKLASLVSPRVMYNNSDRYYREYLFKNKLVEAIIQLPSNLLNGTSINSFLIIFSRGNEKVKLINASNCFTQTSKTKNLLDWESVYTEYNSDTVFTLDSERLINETDITPSKLMMETPIYDGGILLSDVSKIYKGSQYTLGNFKDKISTTKTKYRLLSSSDINEGIINWEALPYVNDDPKLDKFVIHKGDVIITSKSTIVKVAVVDIEPEENVVLIGSLFGVRTDKDKLNPTFLKMFLESIDGSKLLKNLMKGSVIVTIPLEEFKNILLPNVDITFQNEIAKKYEVKLSAYNSLKMELERTANKLKNMYDDLMRGES